jgi:hypothetical protein
MVADTLVIAFALATSASCTVPSEEARTQVTLSYDAFDARGGAYGWRVLNGAGCTDAAVELLTAYANANEGRLSGAQRRELEFHLGQTLAFAGRDKEAVPHFEGSNGSDASPEWQAYVAATLAFLRRDSAALAAAREDYARIAPGSMRLRIIDGLRACPKDSYAKAAHCRM